MANNNDFIGSVIQTAQYHMNNVSNAVNAAIANGMHEIAPKTVQFSPPPTVAQQQAQAQRMSKMSVDAQLRASVDKSGKIIFNESVPANAENYDVLRAQGLALKAQMVANRKMDAENLANSMKAKADSNAAFYSSMKASEDALATKYANAPIQFSVPPGDAMERKQPQPQNAFGVVFNGR